MSLSVCKMDRRNNNKYEELYDCIEDPEDALLLAQLAMSNKRDDELIFIFPGWNRSIKTHHEEEYAKALLLAEKYKAE
jgi:hypothetical protein